MTLVNALVLTLSGCCQKEPTNTGATDWKKDQETEYHGASIRVFTSSKTLTTAERLHIRLEVDAPADVTVELPEAPESGWGDFQLLDSPEPKTEILKAGWMRYERFFELEPWLEGEYVIAPFEIRVSGDLAPTKPIICKVTALIAEEQNEPALKE